MVYIGQKGMQEKRSVGRKGKASTAITSTAHRNHFHSILWSRKGDLLTSDGNIRPTVCSYFVVLLTAHKDKIKEGQQYLTDCA